MLSISAMKCNKNNIIYQLFIWFLNPHRINHTGTFNIILNNFLWVKIAWLKRTGTKTFLLQLSAGLTKITTLVDQQKFLGPATDFVYEILKISKVSWVIVWNEKIQGPMPNFNGFGLLLSLIPERTRQSVRAFNIFQVYKYFTIYRG